MRCPRLLSFSSSCLFVILVTMMVLSQSNPVPLVNQPNWLAVAQELHPGLTPPSGSRLPQGLPPGRRRIAGFKAAAPLSGASQASGLNFAPAVPYGSGGYDAYSVVVADVNGDGKPDLLVANNCFSSSSCVNGTVGVLLGNGDGTFQTAVTYGSGGYETLSLAVGDLNGDGKPDLVVANECASSTNCVNGTVGVLLGNGDGTFQTAVTYGSGGYDTLSLAVGDVNGDGKPDLVVANCGYCGTGNDSVGVLLGNGDGTFQTAVPYDSGGSTSRSVAVGDVNGDGKPDLVVANQCVISSNCMNGLVGVLLGNGDGTFQAAVTYASGLRPFLWPSET